MQETKFFFLLKFQLVIFSTVFLSSLTFFIKPQFSSDNIFVSHVGNADM